MNYKCFSLRYLRPSRQNAFKVFNFREDSITDLIYRNSRQTNKLPRLFQYKGLKSLCDG
jgi:hypothetical protein